MQRLFNWTCCHGIYDTESGRWICSSQSSGTRPLDEEVIGDEGPCHVHNEPEHSAGKLSTTSGQRTASNRAGRGLAAPIQVGAARPKEEKETAKHRLQLLIRDFAHDVVGPGLEVQVPWDALGDTVRAGGERAEALLRMDRRLSRLELWLVSAEKDTEPQDTSATVTVPLQEVDLISKSSSEPREQVPTGVVKVLDSGRASSALTLTRKTGSDLRMIFETENIRDKAYTCLRIFQMSVDQGPAHESDT